MLSFFLSLMNNHKNNVSKALPLSILFFIVLLALGLITPYFSIRINEITGSLALTGIIFSLWGIVRLIIDIPIGCLCDKFNPKKILNLSLSLYAFVLLFYGLVNDIYSLFIVRILNSIAGSLLWVSGWVILRTVSKSAHREENMGVFYSLQSIGSLIGPVIGALLIILFSWQYPFFVGCIIIVIALLFNIKYVSFPKVARRKQNLITLIKNGFIEFKEFGRAGAGLALTIIILFVVISLSVDFLPLYYENILNIQEIGFLLAIGVGLPPVILSIPAGIFGDKYGRRNALILGFIFTIFGLSFLAFSNTFLLALLSVLILNIGFTFLLPTINTLVSDFARDKNYGDISGIAESIKDIGGIIGPLSAGILFQTIGFSKAYIIAAAISLITMISMIFLLKRKQILKSKTL